MRNIGLSTVLFVLSAAASWGQNPGSAPGDCAVDRGVRETPPEDPDASPFGSGPWHVNADRSIWVWDQTYQAGVGRKALWIRPTGTQLVVRGRRVDGEAGPLEASIPGGYFSGFQASGLLFPTPGCWEVTARAGDRELRFVTKVDESDAAR